MCELRPTSSELWEYGARSNIPQSTQNIVRCIWVRKIGLRRGAHSLTRVSMLRLSEAQITAYVESREGVGKAGGYAIQGRAEMLVKEIFGSYSNVVGLPLALTVSLLEGCGYGR